MVISLLFVLGLGITALLPSRSAISEVKSAPAVVESNVPEASPNLTFQTYNVCMTESPCSRRSKTDLETRKHRLYARIAATQPDVLAIQEGSGLFNGITEYQYDAQGQLDLVFDSNRADKALGKKSKYFTADATGTDYRVAFEPSQTVHGLGFYVNPTVLDFGRTDGVIDTKIVHLGTDPEIPNNGKVDNRTPRAALFVRLIDKSTGSDFWVGNVHLTDGLDPKSARERKNQAQRLSEAVQSLSPSRVVVMGDFNEARTEVHDHLGKVLSRGTKALSDAQDLAQSVENPQYDSYQQGWQRTPKTTTTPSLGRHYDRIFFSGGDWSVSRWATAGPLSGGTWSAVASDHIPVIAAASITSQTTTK